MQSTTRSAVRRSRLRRGAVLAVTMAVAGSGASTAMAADAPNPKIERNDGALVERLSGRSPAHKAVTKKAGVKRTQAAQKRMKRSAKRAGVSAKKLSKKQTRHHGSNCAVSGSLEVCWWWVDADGYDDIFYWELYQGGSWVAYGYQYESSLIVDLYALGF